LRARWCVATSAAPAIDASSTLPARHGPFRHEPGCSASGIPIRPKWDPAHSRPRMFVVLVTIATSGATRRTTALHRAISTPGTSRRVRCPRRWRRAYTLADCPSDQRPARAAFRRKRRHRPAASRRRDTSIAAQTVLGWQVPGRGRVVGRQQCARHRRRPEQQRVPTIGRGISLLIYSHSIVAGGFPEMSYTTREMPFTSLTMRRETRSRKS